MFANAEEYFRKTPKSRELWERAVRVVSGGGTAPSGARIAYPPFLDRLEGAYVYDVDGNRYLDFRTISTALPFGHNHPVISGAIAKRLAKGGDFIRTSPEMVELAELLCQQVPSVEQVVFVDSGTRATSYAVRLARAFTKREKFAKFVGGYHGTEPALWFGLSRNWGFDEAPGTKVVRPGIPKSAAGDIVLLPFNRLHECARIIEQHQHELGSIIMEPVLGEGWIPPAPGFLQGIRDLCTRHGILLIFDEMVTLPLAQGGAQKFYGVTPDLTTMGKVIGGGLPIGAIGGRKDIMALAESSQGKPTVHISATFAAHAMAVSAGLAQMRMMMPEVYARFHQLSDRVRRRIKRVRPA